MVCCNRGSDRSFIEALAYVVETIGIIFKIDYVNVRWLKNGKAFEPRKGMPSPRLTEAEFKRRFHTQFQDPTFDKLTAELESITEAAWDAYANSRKSQLTRKAGAGYADPN